MPARRRPPESSKGLLALGAEVRVHDPHVEVYAPYDIVERVDLTGDEVAMADVVVLVTDHDDVDYRLVLDNASFIFDTRHRLDGRTVEHL